MLTGIEVHMRNDQRLGRILHVLIHMNHQQGPITSETLAQMLHTNPVVVRRTMAGLRKQGYVQSEKGHGGGWTLIQPLEKISLLDVYQALGTPKIFAFGPVSDQPDCLVEQAVNGAVEDILQQSEALLLERFAQVSVAEIAAEFEQRHRPQLEEKPISQTVRTQGVRPQIPRSLLSNL